MGVITVIPHYEVHRLKGDGRQFLGEEGYNSLMLDLVEISLIGEQVCTQLHVHVTCSPIYQGRKREIMNLPCIRGIVWNEPVGMNKMKTIN